MRTLADLQAACQPELIGDYRTIALTEPMRVVHIFSFRHIVDPIDHQGIYTKYVCDERGLGIPVNRYCGVELDKRERLRRRKSSYTRSRGDRACYELDRHCGCCPHCLLFGPLRPGEDWIPMVHSDIEYSIMPASNSGQDRNVVFPHIISATNVTYPLLIYLLICIIRSHDHGHNYIVGLSVTDGPTGSNLAFAEEMNERLLGDNGLLYPFDFDVYREIAQRIIEEGDLEERTAEGRDKPVTVLTQSLGSDLNHLLDEYFSLSHNDFFRLLKEADESCKRTAR